MEWTGAPGTPLRLRQACFVWRAKGNCWLGLQGRELGLLNTFGQRGSGVDTLVTKWCYEFMRFFNSLE